MPKLSEIFTLQMGKTPSRSNADYWNNGDNKWLSIADLGSSEKYVTMTKETISDIAVSDSGIKIVPANTVVMSFKLSIGKTAITKEPIYTNEAIMAFIPTGKYEIIPDYIYHLFSGKDWTKGSNKAVKGITLNKATLSEIEIDVPSIEEQREIAAALDKVGTLIAKRRIQLDKLDELIKARFIELFGNLDRNDKGWNELPLGSVCEQVKRYPTFCNMEYLERGIRVIRIGNILFDGHMDTNDENYVFVYEDANKDYPDTVIEENDIVMAVRGDGSAAKRIGIVTEEKLIGANISPNLIRIKANGNFVSPMFLFHYLTGEVGQKRLDSYVNKTAKKNIAAKDIVKVLTPVPPIELQKEYITFVEQTNKSKLAVQEGLEELELLKKAFLQKYFG